MSGDPNGQPYLSWTDDSGTTQTLIFDLVESEEWSSGSDISEHPVEAGANVTDHVRPRLRQVKLRIFATNQPIDSNQWANAVFGPGDVITMPGPTWKKGNGQFDVARWNNQLLERALALTAGGAIGGAVGGALGGGALGGAIGAVAGSALGGALFGGKVETDHYDTGIGLAPSPAPRPFTPMLWSMDNPDDYVLKTIALLGALRSSSQTVDFFGSKDICVGPPGIGGMAIEEFVWVRSEGEGTGASLSLGLKEIRIVSTTTVPAPKASLPRAKKKVSKGNKQPSELDDLLSGIAKAFAAGRKAGNEA